MTFGQSSKSTVCPTFTQKTNPQYLAIEVLRIVYVYWSFLGKCLPNHHHLTILDKDTLLCLLHTATGEVVDGSFHFSVFTFQFVYARLLFGETYNLSKTAPRRSCLITVNRSSRNMQGEIFWI